MLKGKILVLGELTPPYHKSSTGDDTVLLIREPGVLKPSQLITRVKSDPLIKGVICPLGQEVNSRVLGSLSQLRVISNIAVGVNNIDIEAAKRQGVRVAHTPEVLTAATADLAWALLLGGARRLVEGDHLARSGQWGGWEMNQLLGQSVGRYLSYDIEGEDESKSEDESGQGVRSIQNTLGVIGLGEIGKAIARRAQGFEMRVVYHNRTRKNKLEREYAWEYMSLDDVLRESDYVVLALALTPETRHSITRERLSLMKSSAFLVNIGRGALIDEEALIEALESGHLSGAALDVYEREPLIPDRLRALERVTLSPHLGSATVAARRAMSHLAIESAVSVIQGGRLRGRFVV